ncbi:MAG TPA: hypothetical protein VFK11_05190 [Candidatus Saccharimonadales bacterium]|nr:hypothetical protein [Candidatus Saccharimonadales bacterium]
MSDNKVNTIDEFHKTRKGKAVFAGIELVLAYLLVTRAIDTGSLWQYALAILFFAGGLNNLFRVFIFGGKLNAKGKPKKG